MNGGAVASGEIFGSPGNPSAVSTMMTEHGPGLQRASGKPVTKWIVQQKIEKRAQDPEQNQHENEVLRSNTKRLGEETNSDFSIENPT
jgi:hypothetical protein